MTNHAKAFLASRNISIYDSWVCEMCGKQVAEAGDLDVHHIRYRSLGGGNEPTNLIGLCRQCHSNVHSQNTSEDDLKKRVSIILEMRNIK